MSELKPTNIQANRKVGELTVTWNTGHESVYPFSLVRYACPCAECRGGHENMRSEPDPEVFTRPREDSPATRINKIEAVGTKMAGYREVTHCYQRKSRKDWKYNLYTMIHGDSEEQCYRIAEKMSAETGVIDYVLLFSEKEFKKTSMRYF